MTILFHIGASCAAFYLGSISFSYRLNVKAFISNVKTALAATNPVSKLWNFNPNLLSILDLKIDWFYPLSGRL